MQDSARYLLPILVFVTLILSIGTAGYLMIEDDVTVNDAFYMAVTAITPTQFDEVRKLSVPGRYFTVVLVFCGFGAVVAFATQFARLIIQSELEGVGIITRKQMVRRIKRMRDHYIVCGYGEIGGAICGELRDQQLPFVVITNDESSMSAIHGERHALVRGIPTADNSLKEAGIERACGVLALLADDADNLIISLAARELNPQVFIIARAEGADVESRTLRAGADIVVSPMKLGGRQIVELIKQQALGSFVSDALPISDVLGLKLTVYRHQGESSTSAEVQTQTNAVGIAGVQRREGAMEYGPTPDCVVDHGDAVILITRTQQTVPSLHTPTGQTILLADDHRALRLLFARKLAAAGHQVIQAATGHETLQMARQHSPSLFVLDVNMPQRNGYEVCAALRKIPEFSRVPIILYSGEKTDAFVQQGRASGADLCIRKTSKSSELLAKIEELFSHRMEHDLPEAARRDASPTETSSSVDIVDIEVALENVDGDQELLAELTRVFLEETPVLMQRIDAAIDEGNYHALRLLAHTLKSSLAVLGASEVSATAEQLESAGRDEKLEDVGTLHDDLQRQIKDLMNELEQRILSL